MINFLLKVLFEWSNVFAAALGGSIVYSKEWFFHSNVFLYRQLFYYTKTVVKLILSKKRFILFWLFLLLFAMFKSEKEFFLMFFKSLEQYYL